MAKKIVGGTLLAGLAVGVVCLAYEIGKACAYLDGIEKIVKQIEEFQGIKDQPTGWARVKAGYKKVFKKEV